MATYSHAVAGAASPRDEEERDEAGRQPAAGPRWGLDFPEGKRRVGVAVTACAARAGEGTHALAHAHAERG